MNAVYNSIEEKFHCPQCEGQLSFANVPPISYLYCEKCEDFIYDDETGEVLGKTPREGI